MGWVCGSSSRMKQGLLRQDRQTARMDRERVCARAFVSLHRPSLVPVADFAIARSARNLSVSNVRHEKKGRPGPLITGSDDRRSDRAATDSSFRRPAWPAVSSHTICARPGQLLGSCVRIQVTLHPGWQGQFSRRKDDALLDSEFPSTLCFKSAFRHALSFVSQTLQLPVPFCVSRTSRKAYKAGSDNLIRPMGNRLPNILIGWIDESTRTGPSSSRLSGLAAPCS